MQLPNPAALNGLPCVVTRNVSLSAKGRGGRKVAIYRLLQNVPLGPEEIRRLTDAYERTLSALSIKDRNDPLTEFIGQEDF